MMQATAYEDAVLSVAMTDGENSALEDLLIAEEHALTQFVRAKMDRCLVARLDPTDVVQEVFVLAIIRFAEFQRDRKVSFSAWIHALAVEHLVDVRRRHIRAQKRSIRCEERIGSAGSNFFYIEECCCLDEPFHGEFDRDEMCQRVARSYTALSECDQTVIR